MARTVTLFILLISFCSISAFADGGSQERRPDETDRTAEISTALFHQLRAKETRDARREALRRLQESSSMQEKITNAQIYANSHEFQLWTANPDMGDTPAKRHELLLGAFEELTRVMREEAEDKSRHKNLAINSNIEALSLTLHKVSSFQKNVVSKNGLEEVSMLNEIKKSLKKIRDVKDGRQPPEELNEIDEEIMANKELYLHLLRVRSKVTQAFRDR
ncbi:MAG: hypothetical protein GY909_00355 [Oligoflexia bacterium]|nr:hypothetical protein [Oligoflexia bacterium]